MRDLSTKADDTGDELKAAEFNSSQNELENTVTSTDQSLDPGVGPDTDENMLSKALAMYATGGQYYNDSGIVNAYVLAGSTNLKSIAAYKNGQIAIFKAAVTNTGASTINVAGLGVKDLNQYDGSALDAGMIPANAYIRTIYNSVNDRFELMVDVGASEFAIGTIMLFGNATAPIGWTRKTDWQDSAMFCYRASGVPSSGGAINPQTAHNHTGPSHTHTMQNHTHTGPNHLHTTGSLTLTINQIPSHYHGYYINTSSPGPGTYYGSSYFGGGAMVKNTLTTGGGASHNHGNTGNSGTGNTGAPSNNTTTAAGAGNTSSNSAPYYQEVIAATKD